MDDRCEKKNCLRAKAEHSEYCPVHKSKPWENRLTTEEEEYPTHKYQITFHFSGILTRTVQARTEDEALEKARNKRDFRNAEITEPDLHHHITDLGEVKDKKQIEGAVHKKEGGLTP